MYTPLQSPEAANISVSFASASRLEVMYRAGMKGRPMSTAERYTNAFFDWDVPDSLKKVSATVTAN
jgi:hypothetical protein